MKGKEKGKGNDVVPRSSVSVISSGNSLGLSKGSVVEEYAARYAEVEETTAEYRDYLRQKTDEEVEILKKEMEIEENRFQSRLKSEELMRRYQRCVSIRNEKLAKLKIERQLCKENWERIFPGWIKKLQQSYAIIRQYGYDNRTRWREMLDIELTKSVAQLESKYGREVEVIWDLRRLILFINAFTRQELSEKLQQLLRDAEVLEANKDPEFRRLKAFYDEADNKIQNLLQYGSTAPLSHEIWNNVAVKDHNKYLRNEIQDTKALLAKLPKDDYKEEYKVPNEYNGDLKFYFNRQKEEEEYYAQLKENKNGKPIIKKQNENEGIEVEEEDIFASLAKEFNTSSENINSIESKSIVTKQTPISKPKQWQVYNTKSISTLITKGTKLTPSLISKVIDNRRELEACNGLIKKQYKEMMKHAIEEGDWKGAIYVYISMSKWHLPISHAEFQNIISACKNSRPPENVRSDIAVEVLKEMNRFGIPDDVRVYNNVMDCCRIGGHWRRMLAVFKSMNSKGIMANTCTYENIFQACSKAKEHPSVVYDAMKFASIPAYLCYSTAFALSLKYQPNTAKEFEFVRTHDHDYEKSKII